MFRQLLPAALAGLILAVPAAAQEASDSIDVGVRIQTPLAIEATRDGVFCPVLAGSVGVLVVRQSGADFPCSGTLSFVEGGQQSASYAITGVLDAPVDVTCTVTQDFPAGARFFVDGPSGADTDPGTLNCSRTVTLGGETDPSPGFFQPSVPIGIEITDPAFPAGDYTASFDVLASYQ